MYLYIIGTPNVQKDKTHAYRYASDKVINKLNSYLINI